MIKYLFTLHGRYIAVLNDDHLHAPDGRNIGHYAEEYGVFVDMRGEYLGEIVDGDRLLYNKRSPHLKINLGRQQNCGNIGHHKYDGRGGDKRILLLSGYENVPDRKLR